MPRRAFVLAWLAVVAALTVITTSYHHLGIVGTGYASDWREVLLQEAVSVLGGGLGFLAVLGLVRRWPWTRKNWLRRLPSYAAAYVVLSAAHTTWNWGVRTVLYPLFGYGSYDYGILPVRYAMEFPIDVLGFSIAAVGIHMVDRLRATQAEALRAARLEGSLARAQVKNLRLQLQPHFLFNALNTVSSVMYDDPAAADEILDRLATLLRASLNTSRTDEVSLRTELELLDAYLAILDARFGERLAFTREVDEAALGAAVPSMLLQPLVENAVRHGGVEKDGRGTIALRASVRDETLALTVEDDGPGQDEDAHQDTNADQGLGLRATAERLQLLYGEEASFAAGNAPGGGFRVEIRLPWRKMT